jgi:hypothetical protein
MAYAEAGRFEDAIEVEQAAADRCNPPVTRQR